MTSTESYSLYVQHSLCETQQRTNCRLFKAESALEYETINITVAAIIMFQEGKINQIRCETSKDLTLVK